LDRNQCFPWERGTWSCRKAVAMRRGSGVLGPSSVTSVTSQPAPLLPVTAIELALRALKMVLIVVVAVRPLSLPGTGRRCNDTCLWRQRCNISYILLRLMTAMMMTAVADRILEMVKVRMQCRGGCGGVGVVVADRRIVGRIALIVTVVVVAVVIAVEVQAPCSFGIPRTSEVVHTSFASLVVMVTMAGLNTIDSEAAAVAAFVMVAVAAVVESSKAAVSVRDCATVDVSVAPVEMRRIELAGPSPMREAVVVACEVGAVVVAPQLDDGRLESCCSRQECRRTESATRDGEDDVM
jgi:hypothetical protein